MQNNPSTLRVEALNSWEAAGVLQPDWNQLLERSSARTIFLTWEWLTSWWDVHAGARELLLLACLQDDGCAVGLAPLYRWRARVLPGLSMRFLRLVGDGTYDSDDLDFITAEGREVEATRSWLGWLESHRKDWDVLELNPVPRKSLVAAFLLEELRQLHWTRTLSQFPHAVLVLPSDWDAYLRSLSKNMKTAIETKSRRLDRRYKTEFRRCTSPDELPATLDDLYRLHQLRWEPRTGEGAFHTEQRRRFYQAMASAMLQQGWLDLWSLQLNGKVAAVELGFRYRGVCYFLQGGFDTEYSADSVGLVLKARIIREVIQAGYQAYDFLGGDDEYKMRWGAKLDYYLHLHCAAPRSLGAVYLRTLDRAQRGKERLRSALPSSLWETVRKSYRRLRPYRSGPTEEQYSE